MKSFSQEPINYIHCKKAKSFNYIISGNSSLKFVNPDIIKNEIFKNKSFEDFFRKYNDSTKIGIVSSLIIFDLEKNKNYDLKKIKFNSYFELNNILKYFLETSFSKLEINGLNKKDYSIGVYVVYNPNDKKTKIEFVELINNKYYLIYAGNYDVVY